MLALAGTGLFVQHRPVQMLLGIAGGCFLLRLAWSALQQAWRGGLPGAHGRIDRGDFATGLVFSLANPFGLAFWSGVGGSMAGLSAGMPGLGSATVFLVGFAVGAAGWCMGAAATIAWGRRFVGVTAFAWISALSGLALGYFGLRLLWETLTTMLERPGSLLGRLHRAVELG
jgi:threonine/homoserine/homoserine lactone efflux protein